MLKYDHIRLSLEKQFGAEINRIIQGDIVLKLLISARIMNSDDSYSKAMDSYNFKITKEMTPKLYDLCMEVKDTLQFSDKIDFFIVNSPEMNAFAIPSNYKENPHRIALNSTMIDRMDEDELRFVIGHEIGHLVTKTYKLSQMMRFLFQEKEPNLLLKQKFMFWEKLCELSSDRFGLLANKNIEKSISSFFKLISGLPKNVIDFDLEAFIKQNEEYLKQHVNEMSAQSISHPIPSLRVVALHIFSRSKVFKETVRKKKTTPDKALKEKMDDILERFFFMGNETDVHRMRFIASSGLIMAQIDKKITKDEMDSIIDTLANFLLFPKQFIDELIKDKNINDVFNDAINNLLDPKKNKGSIEQESEMMFNYLIGVAVSDNNLSKEEITFLNTIGSELFGFTTEKISYMIAVVLANNFQPLGL
ncbi:MAG: M48 family metallopeptidase [Candidatus Delongbacteria bacterium]|nr:M48 family metallopeptidase [Candidatus Delongbacteria bacterium]MDD4204599.1 M48 family metallopeptidase [Candidatus Delongbacteria bacterium]